MEKYPYQIKKFNYSYTSMEPYIDIKTMEVHYLKHLQGYVNKLNELLKECRYIEFQNYTLEELCLKDEVPQEIKNQAGGVWNHNFFFEGLGKDYNSITNGINLVTEIINQFESIEDFYDEFKKEALSVFGSGYVYLVCDCDKKLNNQANKLEIIKTKNQDIPNLNIYNPLLCIDLWEHAYYLKNYNDRNNYIDCWFNCINWKKAEELYKKNIIN